VCVYVCITYVCGRAIAFITYVCAQECVPHAHTECVTHAHINTQHTYARSHMHAHIRTPTYVCVYVWICLPRMYVGVRICVSRMYVGVRVC